MRDLTEVELKIVDELIDKNQLLDPLFLHSLFTMDPDDLKELCDKHRAGTLIDPYPNKDHGTTVFKCVEVLDESEANPLPDALKLEELSIDNEVVNEQIENIVVPTTNMLAF